MVSPCNFYFHEYIKKIKKRINKHFLNITSVNFDIFTKFLKQRMNQHSSFDSSKNAMTKCFCSKLNFKNCDEVIKKIVNWPIYISHGPGKERICKIAVLDYFRLLWRILEYFRVF